MANTKLLWPKTAKAKKTNFVTIAIAVLNLMVDNVFLPSLTK